MKLGELWNILFRLVKNEQDRGKLYHYLKGLGNINELTTSNKSNLVSAVNELKENKISKEELEELEEIIATSLNDLNSRIGQGGSGGSDLPPANQIWYWAYDEDGNEDTIDKWLEAEDLCCDEEGNSLTLISNEYVNGKGIATFSGNIYSLSSDNSTGFARCINLHKIRLSNYINKFESYCFARCINLTDLNIPKSLCYLGIESLNCTGLETIILPNNDYPNGMNNFALSTNLYLKTLIFSNKLTNIPDGCCMNNINLTNVIIHSSVINIGASAFKGCDNINTIIFLSGTPCTLGNDVFPNNNFKILVDSDSVEDYKTAWPSYEDKIYAADANVSYFAAIYDNNVN